MGRRGERPGYQGMKPLWFVVVTSFTSGRRGGAGKEETQSLSRQARCAAEKGAREEARRAGQKKKEGRQKEKKKKKRGRPARLLQVVASSLSATLPSAMPSACQVPCQVPGARCQGLKCWQLAVGRLANADKQQTEVNTAGYV